MATLVFPATVRDQVRKQHTELRTVLQDALASTVASEDRDPKVLAVLARDLCERFRAHLAFEDEALRPVLAVLDSWGPERVMSLHQEHARQRVVLDELRLKLEAEPSVPELTAALNQLAATLLRDMDEEEQGLLQSSAMAANFLTIERR